MKRVTGIGAIFFKSHDPKRLGEWYRTHLGVDVQVQVCGQTLAELRSHAQAA